MISLLYKFTYWNYTRNRYNILINQLALKQEKIILKNHHINSFTNQKGETNIVFLHGLLDASFGFRKVIPFLDPMFKIRLIDVPGFGRSRLPSHKNLFHLDFFSNLIYEALRAKNLKDLVLVGHSMGGLLAQHIVLEDQKQDRRIKKLILISPGSAPHPERDEIRKLLFPTKKNEIETLLNELYHSQFPSPSNFILNTLIHSWNNKNYQFLAENTLERETDIFFGEKAKNIVIPTWIISGEQDIITPVRMVKDLHNWIPNSKLLILPNAKHALHLEYPDLIANEINNHFK
jgi:3-oxoadipate enol-lactonase